MSVALALTHGPCRFAHGGHPDSVVRMVSAVSRATPPSAAGRVAADWRRLAAPATVSATPAARDGLPDSVRRWLERSLPDREPLSTCVRLEMRGDIRIGSWRPFTADQIIRAGEGYLWAATAKMGPLSVRGFDRYLDDEGEMRWRLAGIVPVMSAAGPDVALSAAGRLASELVLTPAAALSPTVSWMAADDGEPVAAVDIHGRRHELTLRITPLGTVEHVRIARWADPFGSGFAEHDFVVDCGDHGRFDGYEIPRRVRAGWRRDGEVDAFIDFEITHAEFD